MAAINQVFSLLDPQIFRHLLDNYVSRINELTSQDYFRGVTLLLLGTVGVAMVSRIAKNFQDYYVNVIVQRLGTKMYSDSVSHSFSLPYAVFEDQRSGEFLQKLQAARTDSQKLIQNMINIMFLSLIGILFVLSYAFWVHWMIGLAYTTMIPLLALTTYYISRRLQATQKKIIAETASLQGSTTETLRNVELVKSLGLEKQEIDRLNQVNEIILQLELRKIKLVRAVSFIQGTLVNALRSSLLFLMLWLMFMHQVSLGEFFSLLFYSFFVFSPLSELSTVATSYQEAKASMNRLEAILAIKPEPKPKNAVVIEKVQAIDFEQVDFKYETSATPAVSDINISVTAGEKIAFVGPSGSGKSTLIKLLVGLYRPTNGSLKYNGVDISQIDLEALRKKIGFVSQDTQLFAGTIRENLQFAQPGAADEECLAALKSASALTLIERGDKGLETRIGEGGLKLSGGEKQRLAIARALLRKPELIIFDEATSSLDSLTEEEITKTIRNIEGQYPELITILVAHRLSTVMHADTIYVLEKGRVEEQGSHDELLNNHGLYSALWRQQIASKEKALTFLPLNGGG